MPVESTPEFLEKAKKAIEVSDKVESLRAAGSLTGERYDKFRKTLDDKLKELRDEDIKAIDKRLSTIDDAKESFDSMSTAIMSEEMRQEKMMDLEKERSTIDGEKTMLEVCTLQEYAKILRQKTVKSTPRQLRARDYMLRERPANAK